MPPRPGRPRGRPRKRRLSDSTVESTDLSRERRPLPELSIFKHGPADSGEFETTLILITDAVIYGKDGKTIKHPLDVQLDGPLTLRGWVQDLRDDPIPEHTLIQPPLERPVYIEVTDINRWSIGDGPATLWVAGKAGWWEIKPAASYRQVYYGILDAITLWYSIADAHAAHFDALRAKKGKKNTLEAPSTDDVLLWYAVNAGTGLLRDEAEARCDKWAMFLKYQFESDAAHPWKKTPFAQWVSKRHPDIDHPAAGRPPRKAAAQADVPAAVSDPRQLIAAHSGRRASTRGSSAETQDVEMTDASSSLAPSDRGAAPSRLGSRRSAKGVSPGVASMPSPSPAVSLPSRPLPVEQRRLVKSASPAVYTPQNASVAPSTVLSAGDYSMEAQHDAAADRYVEVLRELAQKHDINTANWNKFINKMYLLISMKVYADRVAIVSYYAGRLAQRLPEWKGTPFHSWLVATAQKPWSHETLDPDRFPAQLVRRKKGLNQGSRSRAVSPSPARAPATPQAAATKVPQNRTAAATAAAAAAAAKKTPAPAGSTDRGSAAVRSGQRSGKYPYNVGYSGLRLKRSAGLDDDDNENTTDGGAGSGSSTDGRRRRGQKARKTSHPQPRQTANRGARRRIVIAYDDHDDDSSGLADPETSSGQEETKPAVAGGSSTSTSNKQHGLGPPHTSPQQQQQQMQQLLRMIPTGPNGTWVCDEESCGYVVRAGNTEPGRRAIQEHLGDHEEAMMMIEQVQEESGQNRREQINHLLERIQEKVKISVVKKEPESQQQVISGRPVPPPIKRMFL